MKTGFVFVIILLSFGHFSNLNGQVYTVKKTSDGSLSINGRGDAAQWKSAEQLTHFIYPWETLSVPPTSFAALHDNKWLYCQFRVTDDSINIVQVNNSKQEIGGSDRVEIFLKIDDKMTPYYCLEMDASGRVMDYKADYYRQMHYEWGWPKDQLLIKTSRTPDGYILEAAISLSSLQTLGLLTGNRIQAGLFRAECTSIQNGKSNLKWISWIDPKTSIPDFHTATAFGLLQLE